MRSHLAALRPADRCSHACELRRAMTEAEHRLWYCLRAHRFMDLHFRRQVPLGGYVVDFVCESRRVVIEVDGGQHAHRRDHDEERTRWLEAQGYRVMRFWNNEVMENTAGVLEVIAAAVTPSPALPQGGGREATPSPREKSG